MLDQKLKNTYPISYLIALDLQNIPNKFECFKLEQIIHDNKRCFKIFL